MDQEIKDRLDLQDKKLDQIYQSTEKMRKYFIVSLAVRVLVIVLPLIALAFAIPWLLNILSSAYGTMGL